MVTIGSPCCRALCRTLTTVMVSDLHHLADVNIIVKYADDVNLVIPEKTDIQLHDEFAHIQQWADVNCMLLKTKEIVFTSKSFP